MSNTTSSVIKVISAIIDEKINNDKVLTTNKTLLYKAGSSLTPIIISQVTY